MLTYTNFLECPATPEAQIHAPAERLDAATPTRDTSGSDVAGVTEAQREALFASALQPSDMPTPEGIAAAIDSVVRRFGVAGCASLMAQEFGDHPDAAADRMRWVCRRIGEGPSGRRRALPQASTPLVEHHVGFWRRLQWDRKPRKAHTP